MIGSLESTSAWYILNIPLLTCHKVLVMRSQLAENTIYLWMDCGSSVRWESSPHGSRSRCVSVGREAMHLPWPRSRRH